MDKELFLNGSGIKDPTAYEALKDYKKKETVTMEIYPGDIVETSKTGYLVLNTDDEKYIPALRIYESSNGDKGDIAIKVGAKIKYVNPSKAQHLYRETIRGAGDVCGAISSVELAAIRNAVAEAIGFKESKPVDDKTEPDTSAIEEAYEANNMLKVAVIRLETERNVYRDLYHQLLENTK